MLAAATQVQSAEYLKPLFKLLRSRVCRFWILFSLLSSDNSNLSPSQMTCCTVWQRSYIICKSVNTSERTMRISVCRSAMHLGQLELPWLGRSTPYSTLCFALARLQTIFEMLNLLPLVLHSIHERSAREKISSDQVAHVLNDEVSRKYIQSLKRSVCPPTPV